MGFVLSQVSKIGRPGHGSSQEGGVSMKGLRAMIVAAFVVLFVAGCGGHEVDTQSSVKAIRDLEATWNEEFAARDVDKVVSHYADDAILMAPDGFCDVDDSRDAAVGGSEVPLGEERFGVLGWLVEKVLEGEADLVCASGCWVRIGDV